MQLWIRNLLNPRSGMTNLFGSGIRDEHTGSATLRYYSTLFYMHSVLYTVHPRMLITLLLLLAF
jgi:hypothetical protein